MARSPVVCVGGAVADLTLTLHASAVPASSNPATGRVGAGGVARNVAEALGRLGVPVRLVSVVGDDADGGVLRSGLAAAGVVTADVRTVPGAATARYVAVIDPDGALVIGVAATDLLESLTPADVDRAWAAPAPAWVLADANLPAAALAQAVRRAAATRTPLAVDAVSVAKAARLPADLTGVALVRANADEARAWCAAHGHPVDADPRALAARLLAAGAGAAVVTLGADGLVLADPAGTARVPAAPLPAGAATVDVTGAGDTLTAGVLAALHGGADLRAAVAAGARAAALTLTTAASVAPGLRPEVLDEPPAVRGGPS